MDIASLDFAKIFVIDQYRRVRSGLGIISRWKMMIREMVRRGSSFGPKSHPLIALPLLLSDLKLYLLETFKYMVIRDESDTISVYPVFGQT